jgi:hypothetical protein
MLVEVGDRYRAHGDSAAGDRSSAPKHRPTRMPRSQRVLARELQHARAGRQSSNEPSTYGSGSLVF